MKILQGQIWNQGDQFIQVIRTERLQVQYKSFKNLATRDGSHLHASKKEFCRLIKHATLLSHAQIQQARIQSDPAIPHAEITADNSSELQVDPAEPPRLKSNLEQY